MSIFSRLFRSRISGAYFLCLDLGSKLIKALIFRVSDDGKNIEVVGFGKSERDSNSQFEEGAVADTVLCCKRAIENAAGKIKHIPPQIILGAAGNLLHGDSITKRFIRDDPKDKINIPELKNIIQKIQWNAWNNIRKVVRDETGYSEFNIKLVNSRIQEMKVDGYMVTNPIGFVGREITVTIFNVYSASEHLEFLRDLASKLNGNLLFIAVGPYAVAQALAKSSDDLINALVLDIGDFTTDITFIKENRVKFIKTITLGSRIFNQRLSRELTINDANAELIKIKYSKQILGANVAKKISRILQKDVIIWLNALEISLMNASKQEILPSKIFMHGAGSELPDIKRNLESQDWHKNLTLPRKLQVETLLPGKFKKIINLSPDLNDTKYTTLAALAILSFNFEQNEDQVNQSLRRISRMVSG